MRTLYSADGDTWTDARTPNGPKGGWSTNMSDGGPNSVPVGPPHQGCSGAALGQLWASKQRRTRRLYGFTDLRGKPAEGGGRHADLRIKTSPENSMTGTYVLAKNVMCTYSYKQYAKFYRRSELCNLKTDQSKPSLAQT